ncbi:MAG: polyprenyl synthetase family protein [Mariniphaga sp.]|nr:polyprenyl synthetase family protein [Mariniphaga sp.]
MYTLTEIQEIINSEVEKESERLKKSKPENLYFPVNYILGLKGKKLRPALVLLSYNLFSEKIESALPAAMAIEIFHNFTLLHDDIMDKAELRRNKSTVHNKFSENAAILSGDVMSFISFQYLLKSETPQLKSLIQLFTKTAIEVCEGQQYDMDFENQQDVSEKEYLKMIRLKTAVLLACSLKSGALLAGAENNAAIALYNFGINLGLAFQLQDDLLDSFGNENTFGKKIGGDILSNKKTFLLVKALELVRADQKKKLLHEINKTDFIPENKIDTIKSIFNDLGIQEIAKEKIDAYFLQANNCLNDLPVAENKKIQLRKLAQTMSNRDY